MSDPAVVFDLGNVLIQVDYQRALERLRPRCRSRQGDLPGAIAASVHLQRFESGAISAMQFTLAFCEELGIAVGHDELCSILCDIFSPEVDMIRAHEAIRRAGVETYIFSNRSKLHFDFIRGRYRFLEKFDGWFLSYEMGVLKPDPAAYARVEEGTGRRGSEVVYVDDRPENIGAAKVRGWHAIHHVGPERTLRALRSAGVL
jgi:FMN phosphatase YigB (HAD superfamily)